MAENTEGSGRMMPVKEKDGLHGPMEVSLWVTFNEVFVLGQATSKVEMVIEYRRMEVMTRFKSGCADDCRQGMVQ